MSRELLDQAVEIVQAYVSNNPVAADDLPAPIGSVHATLARLAGDGVFQKAQRAGEVVGVRRQQAVKMTVARPRLASSCI